MRLDLETGQVAPLTTTPGFHFASLSADGLYLVEQSSSTDSPPVTSILNADGNLHSVLLRSAGPTVALPRVQREFLTVKAHDGTELYAQLVKRRASIPLCAIP